ncbi:MAG: 2-oxoisovalerate dehydrogenase subunit beta [Anaerolineae bacterium]|nr:2-oxoisovalerate dehydrogenase subunit beta [Anaerolineae bacterium]
MQKTVIESIRDTLRQEMTRDERIFILGEDVGVLGGVFRATDGLYNEFGPARVMDAPISELAIIGVAIGAAGVGLRPVAEIEFADFIHPAFDQIVNEAAKLRYRTNGDWTCPLVIRTPYGGGVHGALYHSQSIEATFAHFPGIKIVAPATPYDAKGLLRAALADPDPVLYLEHKKTYRSIKGDVPDDDYIVPIGKAQVKRQGDDLAIFAYGMMLHESLAAADILARENISAQVVDLRSLLPIDWETIFESVRKTNRALIVHEDTYTMGLGAEIGARIAEECFLDLDAPLVRVTGPDLPGVPYNEIGEQTFMPNAQKIADAARRLARF